MNKRNFWKIIGFGAAGAGALIGLISSMAQDKNMEYEIDEKVDEALNKRFGLPDDTEENYIDAEIAEDE